MIDLGVKRSMRNLYTLLRSLEFGTFEDLWKVIVCLIKLNLFNKEYLELIKK